MTDLSIKTEPEEPEKTPEIQAAPDSRFNAEIASILAHAESLRLKNMEKYRGRGFVSLTLSLFCLTLGGAGFGWALFFEADLPRALLSAAAGCIVPIALHFWAEQPLKTYIAQYKTVLMPALAQAMGGLKFYPTRGISAKIVQASGLLPAYDEYKAEDCFMGRYKSVKLILSEARLRHKQSGQYLFDGIFVLLEIPDSAFEGHTIITCDHDAIKQWRQRRWAKLQDVSPTRLDALSALDEAELHIFSSAPDTAQKLADESFMKELREMAVLFDNAKISAAFFRKKYLFIMIPYEKDMFEPSNLYVPITSRQDALQCKKEIEQILSIIDVMHISGDKKD